MKSFSGNYFVAAVLIFQIKSRRNRDAKRNRAELAGPAMIGGLGRGRRVLLAVVNLRIQTYECIRKDELARARRRGQIEFQASTSARRDDLA